MNNEKNNKHKNNEKMVIVDEDEDEDNMYVDDDNDEDYVDMGEDEYEDDHHIDEDDMDVDTSGEGEEGEEMDVDTSGEEYEINKDNDKDNDNKTGLKLGDVLRLTCDPKDCAFNGMFVVDYISKHLMRLIDVDNWSRQHLLQVNDDGEFVNSNITSVTVVSRHPLSGYALQHKLLPPAWISIVDTHSQTASIVGQIIELTNDMITVRTTTNVNLYINFGYQGLAPDSGIDKITIVPPPKDKDRDRDNNKDQDIVFDENDIEFTSNSVTITEVVSIDKQKQRFSVEQQANDMLQDMVSKFPADKRTPSVLNMINQTICRFLQLREMASKFNKQHDIIGVLKPTEDSRPLVECLNDFNNPLYWLLMTVATDNTFYNNQGREIESDDFKTMHDLLNEYRSQTYAQVFSNTNKNATTNAMKRNAVNSNMNVVIDNFQFDKTMPFGSSTVFSDKNINAREWVIKRSVLGMHSASTLSAPNDTIDVNGIITLPLPTVSFSRINMPTSNIYLKSALNMCFLNYWQLLKRLTDVKQFDCSVDDVKRMMSSFVFDTATTAAKNEIHQFVASPSPSSFSSSSSASASAHSTATNMSFLQFLEKIVPFTRDLIEQMALTMFRTSTNFHASLSLNNMVKSMEPFHLYFSDIVFSDYKLLRTQLEKLIDTHNAQFQLDSNAIDKYINSLRKESNNGNNDRNQAFDNLMSSDIELGQKNIPLFKLYKLNDTALQSTSEWLNFIIRMDDGRLMMFAARKFQPKKKQQSFQELADEVVQEKEKEKREKDKNKDNKDNKCAVQPIVKKYYSLEALFRDNHEHANVVSDLDGHPPVQPGQFALLIEQPEPTATDFIGSVKTTMYVRTDSNTWVEESSTSSNQKGSVYNDINTQCDVQPDCALTHDDMCESNAVVRNRLIVQNMEDMVPNNGNNGNKGEKEKEESTLKTEMFVFKQQQRLKAHIRFVNNNFQYNIGAQLSSDWAVTTVSPWVPLRNAIMGQSDVVKKYTDLRLFCSKCCQEKTDLSDPSVEWWLYCNKTDTRLLPKFYSMIANVYVMFDDNVNARKTHLDELFVFLKREIGTQSDNKDVWVDKYSGEVICNVEFDTSTDFVFNDELELGEEYVFDGDGDGEEGDEDGDEDEDEYNEKDRNRNRNGNGERRGRGRGRNETSQEELLRQDDDEDDNNDDVMFDDNVWGDRLELEEEQEGQEVEALNPEYEKKQERILQMGNFYLETQLNTLAENMGIAFGFDNTTRIEDIVYNLGEKTKAREKAKENPEQFMSFSLVAMVISTLFVLQTANSPIQATMSYNPHIKAHLPSFDGWPFASSDENDLTDVNFMTSIVAHIVNTSSDPQWRPLSKLTNLVPVLKKYIPFMPPVPRKNRRRQHALSSSSSSLSSSSSSWLFLPPLRRFHIRVSIGQKPDVWSDDYLNVVQSQIIVHSLKIQEEVNNIVKAHDAMLWSSLGPFVENTCCMTQSTTPQTPLQYFISKYAPIGVDNAACHKLNRELNLYIRHMITAKMMLSKVNTKRVKMASDKPDDVSQDTIYLSFISLCKFHSPIVLPDYLQRVCRGNKPECLLHLKNASLAKKIQEMKRNDLNYSSQDFRTLFQAVSQKNIVRRSSSSSSSSNTPSVKLLTDISEMNKTLFGEINQFLLNKLHSPDYNAVRPILNKLMDAEWSWIIEKHVPDKWINGNKTANATVRVNYKGNGEYFDAIIVAHEQGKNKTTQEQMYTVKYKHNPRMASTGIDDDELSTKLNFLKSYIEQFSQVFPTMLINKHRPAAKKLPTHWDIAPAHMQKIDGIIASELKMFDKFNDGVRENAIVEDKMIQLLKDVRANTRQIREKAQTITPDSSPKAHIIESNALNLLFLVVKHYIDATKDVSLQLQSIPTHVAKMLVAFFKNMDMNRQTFDKSFDSVVDHVFREKEIERHRLIQHLDQMTGEERELNSSNNANGFNRKGVNINLYTNKRFEDDTQLADAIKQQMGDK